MRLADEARKCGDDEQDEEPAAEREQCGAERGERERVLGESQYLREEADAPSRVSARTLEVVVELRVLELREVQRRRVLHEPDAHAVGEQIAEQTFDELRCAAE